MKPLAPVESHEPRTLFTVSAIRQHRFRTRSIRMQKIYIRPYCTQGASVKPLTFSYQTFFEFTRRSLSFELRVKGEGFRVSPKLSLQLADTTLPIPRPNTV